MSIKKGIHDTPNRIYTLNVKNALAFQKRMQKAITKDSWFEWLSFARWFWSWQSKVSIKL